jgi:hypothetical protein
MSQAARISELQDTLAAAQTQLTRVRPGLTRKGTDFNEAVFAQEAVLAAERALAVAHKEPHAVAIEFLVQWDTGAPMPYLFQSEHRAFLVFRLQIVDLNLDGTYVQIVRANDPVASTHAIVKFEHSWIAKMGAPNDEVYNGHPLNGKGLEAYVALRVVNSPWIKELVAINSIHLNHRPEFYSDLNHYMFGFHDTTVE